MSDSLSSAKLMLVDDDADVVRVIEQVGKMIGIPVTSFLEGESAVAAFPELNSDIVLIDLGLQGIDGLEVGRRIKLAPGGEASQLVLFSGVVSEETRAQAEEVGFVAALQKPVPVSTLVRLLKRLAQGDG